MDIHNTTEDLVIAEIEAICSTLEAEEKPTGLCTCSQCRQDAVCYVLNRAEPHYVISHRGASRANVDPDAQRRVDLTALAYEGIKRVNHNQRPYFDHKDTKSEMPDGTPVFIIPIIMGRIFNGLNFSPMTDVTIELLQNGKLAEMKDHNWQNPYNLIAGTKGTFTFLPKPVITKKTDTHGIFEFALRITANGYDELSHAFSIPAISVLPNPSLSLGRTFKLPDLFLFPPGEDKNQLLIKTNEAS